MEMCICHHGSIKGLRFLDIILLNGARFLFVCFLWPEFFFFFSLCVKHLFLLLKCSDVLALKKNKNKNQNAENKPEVLLPSVESGGPDRSRERSRDSWREVGSGRSACLCPAILPDAAFLPCLAYLVTFCRKSGRPVPNFALADDF